MDAANRTICVALVGQTPCKESFIRAFRAFRELREARLANGVGIFYLARDLRRCDTERDRRAHVDEK